MRFYRGTNFRAAIFCWSEDGEDSKLQISGDAGDARGGFSREKIPPHPQNPNQYFIQVKTVY